MIRPGGTFEEINRTQPLDAGTLAATRALTITAVATDDESGVRYLAVNARFTTKCRVRDTNGDEVTRGASASGVAGSPLATPIEPGEEVPRYQTVTASFELNEVHTICGTLGGSQGRTVLGEVTVDARNHSDERIVETYRYSFSPPRDF